MYGRVLNIAECLVISAAKKDSDQSITPSPLPNTIWDSIKPMEPGAPPVQAYIAGSEYGAQIGVKTKLNDYTAIITRVDTDYHKMGNKEIMFVAGFTF